MSVLLEAFPWQGIRDPVSMTTHLLGAVLALAALVPLVRRARCRGRDGWAQGSLIVYGVSMAAAFAASALFHLFDRPAEHLVLLKKLDHAAIFLLIGGTGTAVYGALNLPRRLKAGYIAGLWLITLGGLAVKMVVWPMPLWLTALTYLSVGWVAAAGLFLAAGENGWASLRLFLYGALVLSIGAVIFAAEWPVLWPGVVEGHEVFHLLVLAGVGLHYAYIYARCTAPTTYEGVADVAPSPMPAAVPAES